MAGAFLLAVIAAFGPLPTLRDAGQPSPGRLGASVYQAHRGVAKAVRDSWSSHRMERVFLAAGQLLARGSHGMLRPAARGGAERPAAASDPGDLATLLTRVDVGPKGLVVPVANPRFALTAGMARTGAPVVRAAVGGPDLVRIAAEPGRSAGSSGLVRATLVDRQPHGLPADRAAVPEGDDGPPVWKWGGLLLAALLGTMAYRMTTAAGDRRRMVDDQVNDALRCRQVLDGIEAGLWECDFAERTIRWDARCARILDMGCDPWITPPEAWSLIYHPEDEAQVHRALETAVLFGSSFRVECRLRAGGDVWRWVELRGRAVGRGEATSGRLAGTLSDISARKRDELVLRERDERSRRLLASLPEAVLVLDNSGRVVECHLPESEGRCWTSLDAVGKEFEKAWPPEAAEALTRGIGEAMTTGRPARMPLRQNSAGAGCDAEMTVSVLGDRAGNPLGFLCLVRDVTELRCIEDRARTSETLAGDLVDSLSAHVAVLDRHGIVRAANAAWRAYAPAAGSDLRPQPGEDYLAGCRARIACADGVEAEAALVGIRAVMTGTSPEFQMEYRVPAAEGPRWFAMRVSPLRSSQGGVVMAHEDVTARKRAENAAREVFLRVHRIAAQLPGVLFQCRRSSDGRYSFPYMSDGARQVFGLEPEALRHDAAPWLALIDREDRAMVLAALEASADCHSVWSQQFRLADGEGESRWLSVDAVCESAGDCTVWNGFMADVTERKRADDRIARSERAARERFRTLPVACISLEPDGRLVDANDRWRALMDLGPDEPCGRPIEDFVAHADRAALAAFLDELRAGRGACVHVSLRKRDGDYVEVDVEGSAEPEGKDGKAACLICITLPMQAGGAGVGNPAPAGILAPAASRPAPHFRRRHE